MADKGTRVQISPELHEMIKEQYQIQKSRGVKGISQLKLLEELCKAGLDYQKQMSLSGSSGNLEGIGIHHPISSLREYIINSKSELKVMEEAILEREKRLLHRERHLDKRENFINDKYETTYHEKESLLEVKKKVNEDSANGIHERQKIKDQENTISELKKENKELRKEIITLLKKIDRKTEKDPFFDYTLPFIAPVMMGYSIYKDHNRDEAMAKMDPTVKKIIDTYSKATKEEREKLNKNILGAIDIGQNKLDNGQNQT